MNKKLLLGIIVCFMLVPIVSANLCTEGTGYLDCDTFNRSAGVDGASEGQNTSYVDYTTGGVITNNKKLKVDDAGLDSAVGSKLSWAGGAISTVVINITNNITGRTFLFATGDAGGHDGACGLLLDGNAINYYNDASDAGSIGITNTIGNYNLLTIITDATNNKCYYKAENGTHEVYINSSAAAISAASITRLHYHPNYGDNGVGALIEDMYICDGYNFSCYPPPIPGDPVVQIEVDFVGIGNNTQYNQVNLNNYVLDINFETNDTISNCTLYRNNIANGTITGIEGGITDTFEETFTNTTQEKINYSIFCIVHNQSTSNATTETIQIWVDTVNPVVTETENAPASVYGKNKDITYTLTDAYLYYFNFSIDGTQLYNASNLGVSEYNLNITLNGSAYSPGIHNISLYVADGHTAEYISEYDKKIIDNELQFYFSDYEIKIYPKNKVKYDWVKTTKLKDRYNFEFNLKDNYFPDLEETFIIESDKKIVIAKNSPYQGHVIIGNKWVDFATDYNNLVNIKRINDNTIEAIVKNPSRNMKFNSIGDLNVVNETYSWYLSNATVSQPAYGIETDNVNFTLIYLNYDVNLKNMTAIFNFDNNMFNVTPTLSENTYTFIQNITIQTMPNNLTFGNNTFWNFTTILDDDSQVNYSTDDSNFTSYQMFFDECIPNANNTALYINVLGEISEDPIIATINGNYLLALQENITATKNLSIILTSNSTYHLCINPSFAEYYVDGSLSYFAPGFNSRTAFFTDKFITNTSQNLTLLLVNSSLVSRILLTVTDEYGGGLLGYFVETLKFDDATDTFSLVETSQTDYKGETSALLEINDVFYKFNIKNSDGVLVRTIPSLKIFRESYIFQIKINNDYGDIFLESQGVSSSLTYNNATDTFTLVYADSKNVLSEMCLRVDRMTALRATNICNTCLSTSSGSISCVIDPSIEGVYVASAVLDTTSPLSDEIINQMSVAIGIAKSRMLQGNLGLFLLVLLLTTITFMVTGSAAGVLIINLVIIGIGVTFGMVSWGWTAFMSLLVIGVFLIYKMKS